MAETKYSIEKGQQVLRLRARGLSYSKIGKQMKISPATVMAWQRKATDYVREVGLQEAEVVRNTLSERVDTLSAELFSALRSGKVNSARLADQLIKAIELSARLHGLDLTGNIKSAQASERFSGLLSALSDAEDDD